MTARAPCSSGAIVAVACACALAGCASLYDRAHRFDDGWRIGKVEQVGTDLEAPAFASNDCRSAAPAATPSPVFASVRFTQMRHHLRRIVLLAARPQVGAGDMVYFRPRDCAVPAVLAARAPR